MTTVLSEVLESLLVVPVQMNYTSERCLIKKQVSLKATKLV